MGASTAARVARDRQGSIESVLQGWGIIVRIMRAGRGLDALLPQNSPEKRREPRWGEGREGVDYVLSQVAAQPRRTRRGGSGGKLIGGSDQEGRETREVRAFIWSRV